MASLRLTDKLRCANCAIDRRNDMIGVCGECYTLYLSGQDVKIKDTMDKDNWSCGCFTHDYGDSYQEGGL